MTAEFVIQAPGDEFLEEWPDGLPPHFSPSQIKLARKCMEQYRQRYVLGRRTPPGKALMWGRADHTAAETNFIQKVRTQTDMPTPEVLDAFRDAVIAHVDEEGGLSEIDWGEETPKAALTNIIDDGTRLAGLYHEQLAPTVLPTATEEWLELALPGIPVPLKGKVDVREDGRILERKTHGTGQNKPKAEERVQAMIYSAATDLPVDFHIAIRPKTAAGTVKVLAAPEKEDGEPFRVETSSKKTALLVVRRTLAQIGWAMRTYGPDNPWPDALAHDWACGYCGNGDAGICTYWHRNGGN